MYMIRMLLEGHPGQAIRIILHTVTLIEFMVSGFMTFLLVAMILLTIDQDAGKKKEMRIIQVILTLHIIMLVISQFSPLYYYFDTENYYHRSPSYILSNVAPLLMMIQGVYCLIRYGKQLKKQVATAFWIYLLAPIGAVAVRSVVSFDPQLSASPEIVRQVWIVRAVLAGLFAVIGWRLLFRSSIRHFYF